MVVGCRAVLSLFALGSQIPFLPLLMAWMVELPSGWVGGWERLLTVGGKMGRVHGLDAGRVQGGLPIQLQRRGLGRH